MKTPLIGICGFPRHGKTTVQRILTCFGVDAIDDSEPLRRVVMAEFGLSWDDVSTQAGKLQMIEAFGTTMTVRQALGDLGKVYEAKYGANYWIDRAITDLFDPSTGRPASFGSVRMGQGSSVKYAGGVIIEVRRPSEPASRHDFDQYDQRYVDHTIINDGRPEELAIKVIQLAIDLCETSLAGVARIIPRIQGTLQHAA